MPWPTLVVFVLTYAGLAVGGLRGLGLDRTGFALLGAIAIVATGRLTINEAWAAIDPSTIVLLYSLMVVSAQFRLGGSYTALALRLADWAERPRLMLAGVVVTAAILSAVMANDIVCLAFTPVLCLTLLRAGRNPVPFLLALAAASNVGSAATIIGNPQNMLIGQVGGLDFAQFLLWCGPPAAAGLIVVYGTIAFLYRDRWDLGSARPAPAGAEGQEPTWPAYDRVQTIKGLIVTLALVVAFFTPIPREVSALTAAGVLLVSRKLTNRSLLGLVDWHLITLFAGLFVVIAGLEATGLPERAVDAVLGDQAVGAGMAGAAALGGLTAGLSNLVSNVPAVMLLIPRLDPGLVGPWYILALSSTLAGNLLLVGSIANLIVVEQAAAHGVRVSFGEHLRAGLPITLATLALAWTWVAVLAG